MDKLNENELSRLLENVRQGKLKGRELYHALHEFGRNYFLQARKDVEGFLTNADPQLRAVALEVLVNHWRLQDFETTSRDFLEHDPDRECRIKGASALEVLKRNTNDKQTLSLLAGVVHNEQEALIVREAAYAAMLGIVHYDPAEQFRLASKGIKSPQEIDWKMVDSYL
jgi:hypothetical protein